MINYIKQFKEASDKMIVERHIESVYNKLPNLRNLVDVGANHGTHTKGMLEVKSCVNLVSIEANPEIFKRSLTHISSPKLKIINAAATPNSLRNLKNITFKVKKEFHGRGGIEGLHIWKDITPDVEFDTITVPTINFDDLLLNNFKEGVDFIKMDIEGAEYSIILESEILFSNPKYRPILVLENSIYGLQLSKKTFKDLINFININNLALLDFNYNNIKTEEDLWNFNMVWICPNEKIKDLTQ